jgi:GGDEF domain-containing protein
LRQLRCRFPDQGTDLRSSMNKADQAMYLAQQTGRNRFTVFDSDERQPCG